MKFQWMLALTALSALLLVSTLEPPLLTEAVRSPLQFVVVLMALVTWLLDRMLRPKPGARPGALVRNVMLVTLIKMAVVMVGILFYSLLDMPDPTQFSLATYLIYAAFTAILVAEAMRHEVSPTEGI